MNVRLALASAYVPGFMKRKQLDDLLRRSAAAFGVPAPDVEGKSYRECLRAFATFTAELSEAAWRGDRRDATTVRTRLRGAACDAGREIRRKLRIGTRVDAMKAARLVYRMLGIDFDGRTDGTIVIRSCAFSRVYTPRACALVSGLDEGLLAGLAGEGRLEFSARITEGCARCEATFHFADAQP